MKKTYFPQRERTDLLYIDGLLTKLDDITAYKANKPENEPIVRRFKQARSLLANGCDGSLRESMEGGCPAYKCFVAMDIGTMNDKHPKCVYAYREVGV